MEERLDKEQVNSGLSAAGLRIWGMLFLFAGMVGRCVIQNGLLGLQALSTQALLAALSDPQQMLLATVSLVCQVLEACAIPIFAFLLVEGFCHSKSLKGYLLRVAGLAVLSELPYNLAMGGKLLVTDSRNPVFGILVCLVVLYLYRHYAGKSAGRIAIKAAVTLAAVLWCAMLGIEHGPFLVLLVAALWSMRDKKKLRVFVGCVAAVLGCLFSMLNLAAPMSFLAIHFYNGEKGEQNRYVSYLYYPVLLLAIFAVTLLMKNG